MKALLHSVATVCAAALMSIAASQASLGSDRQIQVFSPRGTTDGSIILAQAQTQRKARSGEASNRTKLKVDSSGVILKRYDPVAYFK